MSARRLLLALALMLVAAAAQVAGAAVGATAVVVASITDGDTLTLTNAAVSACSRSTAPSRASANRGERGRHARRLLDAARAAKAARRGLWGASPSTALNPERQVDTGRCGTSEKPVPLVPPTGNCDPNYAGACVPPYPPDLDCTDLRAGGLDLPVRVVGSDPHRLDGDGDGLGCE